MKLFNWVAKGFTTLWPEKIEDGLHAWRIAMFFAVSCTMGILMAYISASEGFLEDYGIYGHAKQIIVSDIEMKQNAILYGIYAPQVRSKVSERCRASTPNQREKINQELDRILKEYAMAAREDFYPIPRCEEV